MIEKIESFYKQNNTPDALLKKKLMKFEAHKDIAREFEYWISNNRYLKDGCIVEGYSAKQLADEYVYLNGEGAFILLIELRENPAKALKRISDGFKLK